MTTADKRARRYIDLKNQGLTYAQIAELEPGTTGQAVRNSIRRYVGKGGDINASPTVSITPPPGDLKIFVYDIERSPMETIEKRWSLKTYPGFSDPKIVKQRSKMVSWAGKFLNGPMLYASQWDHGFDKMVESLWHVFDAADIVVGFNNNSFDNRHVAAEFFLHGLDDPSPFRSIDLYRLIKSQMNFDSFKLDHISGLAFDDHKVDHGGYMKMLEGSLDGDVDAQKMFAAYNKQDVALTERWYYQFRSRIKNHPPVLHEADGNNCNVCGSDNLVQSGWKLAITMRYPALRCQECGWQGRAVKGGERISLVSSS